MALQAARNREISAFQFGQELGPLGLGSGLPHDLAAVDRLTLALGLAGRAVRQQVIDTERLGVGHGGRPRPCTSVGPSWTIRTPAWRWPWIRRSCPLGRRNHRSRSRLSCTDVQVVPAGEQAGAEAPHHAGHLLRGSDRRRPPRRVEDRVEVGLDAEADRPAAGSRVAATSRIVSTCRRIASCSGLTRSRPLSMQAGQPAQLRLREPPFFASRFRPSDCRTSSNASAIRNPGGWSGPPWSSLRMPRTAAQ